jgi:hypothetical protein
MQGLPRAFVSIRLFVLEIWDQKRSGASCGLLDDDVSAHIVAYGPVAQR